jgi:hypothetical protein
MIEEAETRPVVYDDDSPKLTPEQLTQFRPVNYKPLKAPRQPAPASKR